MTNRKHLRQAKANANFLVNIGLILSVFFVLIGLIGTFYYLDGGQFSEAYHLVATWSIPFVLIGVVLVLFGSYRQYKLGR